ncbi:MAG: hypothetical protein JXQ76_04630, partial [Campylobacterales bacterium]|nr:hypothetical protein [Campylobacterales bacterium]
MLLTMIFLLIFLGIIALNLFYKEYQHTLRTQKIYSKLALEVIHKLEVLIEEKKNATRTISLALAQDYRLQQALLEKIEIQAYLHNFSLKLRNETDFKNVWFQIMDKNATVVARSWCKDRGDNLFASHEFHDTSKVVTSIDVDRYDLTFKARVPLFDDNNQSIGFLETLTHFNSIAKKIAQEDFEPIIVVNQNDAKKLQFAFSQHFIEGYYIANKDIDTKTLEYIKKYTIDDILKYKTNYAIKNDYLHLYHTLFDEHGKVVAHIVMLKALNKIDKSSLENLYLVTNIVTFFALLLLVLIFFGLYYHSAKGFEAHLNTKPYLLFFALLFVASTILFFLI